MAYMLIPGKEGAANCVPAINGSDTCCRLKIPYFKRAYNNGVRRENGINGSEAYRLKQMLEFDRQN